MTSLGDLPLAHPVSLGLDNVQQSNTPIQIPAWTIQDGQLTQLQDNIVIHSGGTVWRQSPYQAVLSFEQIGNLCVYIDSLAKAPTTYTNITSNSIWRQFYQKEEHDILYADGLHTEESMPCMYCGIVLPPRLLQMDHQRPQVGGEIEAIVKTMRVLGLTMAGPHGEKCTQLSTRVSEIVRIDNLSMSVAVLFTDSDYRYKGYPVPRLTAVTPRGMRPPVQATSTTRQRYTLSEEGELFFSVVRYLGLEDRLVRQAMHSVTNLRPLCGLCNGSRGNGDLKVNKM